MGNRLSAVASSPNQAANPTGWRLSETPSGMDPQTSQDTPRNSSGSPSSSPPKSGGRTATRDIAMPTNSAGTANRKPAIGPAMPMSNTTRLLAIGSRMRMKAPKVAVRTPQAGGKKGRDAATRENRPADAKARARRAQGGDRARGREIGREADVVQASHRRRGEHGQHEQQDVEPDSIPEFAPRGRDRDLVERSRVRLGLGRVASRRQALR